MNIEYIIEPDLKSPTDPKWYEGAEDFIHEFSSYKHPVYYTYSFLEKETLDKAIQSLSHKQLKYRVFYALELEPAEWASYPAFFLSQPTEDQLLFSKGKKQLFSEEIMQGQPLLFDFASLKMLVSPKLMKALSEAVKGIAFQEIKGSNGSAAYLLDGIHEFKYPVEYKEVFSLMNNAAPEEHLFSAYTDGRALLDPTAAKALAEHGMVKAPLFSFDGKKYQQSVPLYLVSGKLAATLHKSFKELHFIPLTQQVV